VGLGRGKVNLRGLRLCRVALRFARGPRSSRSGLARESIESLTLLGFLKLHSSPVHIPWVVLVRTGVLKVLLLLVSIGWAAYPGDDLLPDFTLIDSISLREWGDLDVPGSVFREDMFVRSRDGAGRITRYDKVMPSDSGRDSVVTWFDWTLSIPNVSTTETSIFRGTPTKKIEVAFHDGIMTASDTTWSSWDASNGILVERNSAQYSACRWTDSAVFDAENQLLFEAECNGDTSIDPGKDTTVVPDHYLYRAGYANATDTLPDWESARDTVNGVSQYLDTLADLDNPNHPDSLYLGSDGIIQVLVRDASGRVIENFDCQEGTRQVTWMENFIYDAQGRLISDIQSGTTGPGDTVNFLYSWSDQTAIRTQSPDLQGFRIVGHALEVNFTTSERVRIDEFDMQGRVLANLAEGPLPAGRTVIPLPSNSMGIVRLRTTSGESEILVPPR